MAKIHFTHSKLRKRLFAKNLIGKCQFSNSRGGKLQSSTADDHDQIVCIPYSLNTKTTLCFANECSDVAVFV